MIYKMRNYCPKTLQTLIKIATFAPECLNERLFRSLAGAQTPLFDSKTKDNRRNFSSWHYLIFSPQEMMSDYQIKIGP